jgi:HAD superfamily hydrolase (TIGR01509 family)
MLGSLTLGQDRFMNMAGVLFDMDGTLVDSDAVVARVWTEWSTRNGADPAEVLRITPGRPARDSLRDVAPWLSAAERDAEADALLAIERADLGGVVATEGATELIAWLVAAGIPYGIVTSADRPLAVARLGAAGIAAPEVLITASETVRGKPDPEGYLAGAARLGITPGAALVVEDSLAGVLAGKAAGAVVAALRGVPGADLDITDLVELHTLLKGGQRGAGTVGPAGT